LRWEFASVYMWMNTKFAQLK